MSIDWWKFRLKRKHLRRILNLSSESESRFCNFKKENARRRRERNYSCFNAGLSRITFRKNWNAIDVAWQMPLLTTYWILQWNLKTKFVRTWTSLGWKQMSLKWKNQICLLLHHQSSLNLSIFRKIFQSDVCNAWTCFKFDLQNSSTLASQPLKRFITLAFN